MATTTNNTTTIKHVYGNVLKLAIPLTLRTITLENGTSVATDTDYIPSSGSPVVVEFGNINSPLKHGFNATMRDGNVAVVEDKGTIPVGCYAITVCCTDDNGDPRRFKQRCVLNVVDVTADAGIEAGIEFEGTEWYLDAAIFLAVKGEDGADGADGADGRDGIDGRDGTGIDYITTSESSASGAYNVITFHLTDGTSVDFHVRNGESKEQVLPAGVVTDLSYVHTDNNYTDDDKGRVQRIDNLVSTSFGGVYYDNQTRRINFYTADDGGHENVLAYIDASPFVLDGMLSAVQFLNNNLVFTFNTDSGKAPISIPVSLIFDYTRYYTKDELNSLFNNFYNKTKVYTKTEVDGLVDNKADLLSDGKMPVSQAAPVVIDYIYTPPPAPLIPVLPTEPSAGDVIYFNNDNKIRRYYFETAGQSGGVQSLTYIEETPSKYVVYYNKDDEKFYRYNGTTLVEIETGGTGDGTVTAVKMNNGTPIEPDSDGVVDLGTVLTEHQSLADYATTSAMNTALASITSQIEDLDAQLNPFTLSLSASSTLLEYTGNAQNVTYTATMKRGSTTVTPDSVSVTCNGSSSSTSTLTVALTNRGSYSASASATKDGTTKTASASTKVMHAMRIGFGTSSVSPTSYTKQTLKNSVGDTYTATNSTTGYYLWICVDDSLTVSSVKSGGFDVPVESATTSGGYKCYRSSEPLEAGSMTITLT